MIARLRRPLLLGEAPSRSTEGAPPFSGRSGERLRELAGVDRLDEAFSVANLLDRWPGRDGKGSAFPLDEARRAADRIEEQFVGRVVVLVGKRVCRAVFGGEHPYLEPVQAEVLGRGRRGGPFAAYVLPHPSGINRWWNVDTNRARARRILRWLAVVGREIGGRSERHERREG